MAFLKRRAGFKKTSFIVKPEYKHQAYSVSSKGHTVFRIFPAPTEGGGFDPQIVPVDGDPLEGLGNSFAEVETVSWFGKDKLSFITTCSDVDGEENISPCLMFYNVVGDFVKAEGKKAVKGLPFNKALTIWSGWFGDQKGIASLPQTRMLLQGVLIEHAGEPCTNKAGAIAAKVPIVLELNRSATISLEDGLVTKANAAEDLSATNCKIGDITSLEGGKAIKVYSYKNKEKQTRYAVDTNKLTDGTDAPAVPLKETLVLSHFVPWEDLLNIQPASWQIEKLVEQFGPEATDFALRDDATYSAMLPEGVAGSFDRAFGEQPTTTVNKQPTSAAPQTVEPSAMVIDVVGEEEEDEIPMGDAPVSKPATDSSSVMAIAMEAAKNAAK